jgi:hypothetical protein
MPNSTAVTWPAISELIPVVVFVGIAACIYMIAGFGFALFAVPSISLFMPVTEAVALLSLLGLTSVLRQSLTDLALSGSRCGLSPECPWATG